MAQIRNRVTDVALPGGDRRGDRGGDLGPPSPRLGAYLRRLREGYGYTLRRVEEKSALVGELIDNSQLSRFENGKAAPSFDKLRALARVFNVSVQHFSDVLDLEEFESEKPDSFDYEDLLRIGAEAHSRGEYGRAFVTFERALEVAESASSVERIAEARWRMAASLKALGKLSMTERELREILKLGESAGQRVRTKALLQLAFVYRDLSDLYVAGILAREALDLAVASGDLAGQAAVLNMLGNVRELDDPSGAIASYERAHELLATLGTEEDLRLAVLVNWGGCLVKAGRFDDGVTRLQEASIRARERGARRTAALASTRLAEAYVQRGRIEDAARYLAESDTLAADPRQPYNDILFLNAFHRWATARAEDNATRERIAFGRLRHLRPLIERRFPEVDIFDRHVESHRRMTP